MKKVIIRTDASTKIGSGHVMRCLTIGKKLKKYDIQVKFWMENLPGNLIEYVKQEGFDNILQEENSDLYIIDHYDIDEKWEKSIIPFTKHIMVIDDLANRKHICELLIDQNAVPNFEKRYENLVSKDCKKLLGPKYLILRDEFIETRKKVNSRNSKVERLLIFMGGSDPTNETLKILQALSEVNFKIKCVDVVVGNSNINRKIIEDICLERGYKFHCQIDYMAQLMKEADFSIGSGGITAWERCFVGLPSSSTIVAENQIESTEYAADLGAVINLGWHERVTVETYKELLCSLEFNIDRLKQLSDVGLDLTKSKKQNAWLHEILELLK